MGKPSQDSRRGYTKPLPGISYAFRGVVKFCEILQDGFQSPLKAPQIAGLFQAGCLGRYTPTYAPSPAPSRGQWHTRRTIDNLLPLEKYEMSPHFSAQQQSATSQLRVRLPAAIVLCLVSAVATAVIGYLFFGTRPSPDPQIASSIAASAASPSSVSTSRRTKNKIAQAPGLAHDTHRRIQHASSDSAVQTQQTALRVSVIPAAQMNAGSYTPLGTGAQPIAAQLRNDEATDQDAR